MSDKNEEEATETEATTRPTETVVERRREYRGCEIYDICDILDSYPQFEPIPEDTCLDPHDDNGSLYRGFRAKDGSRLTKEIVDGQCIFVGNDKCGLSAVLDLPVPPGATLSVKMSTWCNPCHGGYGVENSSCFGVGMVPVGGEKEQQWLSSGFETVIENGVQYHAALPSFESLMAGGGVLAMLAKSGGDVENMVERTFDVMQGGTRIRRSSDEHPTLDFMHVRIARDTAGASEFSFEHGGKRCNVSRPADDDEENYEDMQLFFNCRGWADNNTYVQVHEVVMDPQPPQGDTKPAATLPLRTEAQDVDAESNRAEDFPDYFKILKDDPENWKEVDALIKSKMLGS